MDEVEGDRLEESKTTVEHMETSGSSSVEDENDDHEMMLHLHDLWSSIANQENDSLPHHASHFSCCKFVYGFV